MSWKNTLATVAPQLAKSLGGPLAGMATNAVLGVLGIKKPSEIDGAMANATPETLMQLKCAEQEFLLRMEELGVDVERLHAQDRDSAREREAKVGGWANSVLAAVVIGGFFAVVGYVLMDGFQDMNPQAGLMIGSLIGYVSSKADQVVSYYFGSSSSSARKTELLKTQQPDRG